MFSRLTEEFGFIIEEQERSRGDGPLGKVLTAQAEQPGCDLRNHIKKSSVDF